MKRFHRPASRAFARTSTRICGYGVPGATSSSSACRASSSTGYTCSPMNSRIRSRSSATRGVSSKSTWGAYPAGRAAGLWLAGGRCSLPCSVSDALSVEPDLEREEAHDHERGDAERRDEHGWRHVLLDDEGDRGGDHHHPQGIAQEPGRHLDRELAADQYAGDRADEDIGGEPEVDVAADPVGSAGGPEQDGRVDYVGPDDALRGESEYGDQDDRDQRAAPGGGQADHEAGRRARDDRRDDMPAVQMQGVALGDHGAQEKGPDDGGDADNEKGRPHCTQHHLVDRVLAVLPLKELDQEHARDRHRDAPYRQPEHDRPMNGPVLQVPPCARGLGDGAVEDVRPHGRHRLDPDQEADPEPEDDDYRIHEMSQLPHRGPSQAFMLFQSAW